jgi:DNA-binding CsgD family transcriptional regulator
VTDDAGSFDKQSGTPENSGDLNAYVSGVSQSSILGIAIYDANLRYVAVNNVLAAMNGIPPEMHIGRTVGEIIGPVASTVEPMLRSVLSTGQSILNVEIRGELPTREGPGYWIVDYIPIRNSADGVKLVGALALEITKLRKIEDCIHKLMSNLPRTSQVSYLGAPDQIKEENVGVWSNSLEMVGICMEEMLKDSQWFQSSGHAPSTGSTAPQQPHPVPSRLSVRDETSRQASSVPITDIDPKSLSPREAEIVKLLATGKGSKEISNALHIEVTTVVTYRARVMLKLQVHSITELVLYAVRHGLVRP